MSKQKNNFLVQGSILAMAGILVRVIGIIYRVPLNSILGDDGISYYSTAYDIYSLFLLISSMSMPIAVSKIVSARVAKGQLKNAYRAFLGAVVFGLIIGAAVFAIVFFGADAFAKLWKFPSAALAIKTLAPTLFIMSFLGVLRGFFQGLGTMMPTAVSQILEQIVNAIVSISAALILFDMGEKVGQAEAYSAAGGTLGTLAGAFAALLFMFFVFMVYRPVYKKNMTLYDVGRKEEYGKLTKVLVLTIAPVLLSTTVYNLGSLIDSGIFGNVMSSYFKMEESSYSSLMGIYSGKFKLLTTAPIAIASALSSAVIPSLVNSYTEKNRKQLKSKVDSTIKLTMLVAVPCGMGLSVLGLPIVKMLFRNVDNVQVCEKIMLFSFFTVVFYSFSTITNAVLQGIDRMKVPVVNATVSLILHVPFLLVLLMGFKLKIYGVVIADFVFALIVCILNIMSLKKYMRYRIDVLNVFIKPLMAAIVMGAATLMTYKGFMMMTGRNTVSALVAIIVAVVIYGVLLLVLKAVTSEELLMLPKGRKIEQLLKRLKLL